MAEMPERIWMPPYDGKYFKTKTHDLETEYVLASTHTRAMEALAEAEKAIRQEANVADVKRANATAQDEMQFWRGRHSGLLQAAERFSAALIAAAKGEQP